MSTESLRRLAGLAASLGLLVLLAGCSSLASFLGGGDGTIPPNELQPLSKSLPLQQRWQRNLSSGTSAGRSALRPDIADGRLYLAGAAGDLSALELETGLPIWQADVDLRISAGVGLGEGLVLVGGLEGEVLALSQRDGSQAWSAQVSSEVLAVPVVADGVVVVRSIDGYVIGFEAATGKRIWSYNYTLPTLTLRGASSPLIAQGLVIVGQENGKIVLLGLRDGIPVGEKNIATPRGRTELERISDIDAELHLVDGVLYVASYQGKLSALDLRAGESLWQQDLATHTGLTIDDRQLYLVTAGDDSVIALDRSSGQPTWRRDDLARRRLSPPVSTSGYVIVGDFEGYVHWLDRRNGEIVGRVRANSSGISQAPVIYRNVLYVLGNSGELSAISLPGSS